MRGGRVKKVLGGVKREYLVELLRVFYRWSYWNLVG